MVAYWCTFFLIVIKQIYGVKKFQIINLAQDGKYLIIINTFAYHSQVDIRTLAISALRPRAENQNFLDFSKLASKHNKICEKVAAV